MSDFALNQVSSRDNTIGFGAVLVALSIVAALVLAAVKISSNAQPSDLPSLIDLENPASHSGFTA